MNKYEEMLSQYNTNINDENVAAEVAEILRDKVD